MKVRAPCDIPHTDFKKGDILEATLECDDPYIDDEMRGVVKAGCGFFILRDGRITLFCRWEKCAHINGLNWEKVE